MHTPAMEGGPVASCSDMQVGEVYVCPECGLELEVVKACGDSDHESCGPEQCKLMCCDQALELKA